MNFKNPSPAKSAGPTAPKLSVKDILAQFWADVYGKEVQTAATYSYTWLADQFGHLCIGIVVDFAATAVAGLLMVWLGWAPKFEYDTGIWPGLIFTIAVVVFWEWRAYQSSVEQATGAFPLDSKLLRDNAIIAATYMALGAILGFAFHLPLTPALLVSAGAVIIAIVLAPPWLRQKIVWQKASIPYLFRLADAAPNIGSEDAKRLQSLIDAGAPPVTTPCQIIIGGPIGSGRTSMAAGIATEFAFKKTKVRYLGLDCLLEFATNTTAHVFPDDAGPATISYWPWSQAQVVIIDGIGPFVASNEPGREANVTRFMAMLQNELGTIAGVLNRCHTVWEHRRYPGEPSRPEALFIRACAPCNADHISDKMPLSDEMPERASVILSLCALMSALRFSGHSNRKHEISAFEVRADTSRKMSRGT
jgi:hypothetical protein